MIPNDVKATNMKAMAKNTMFVNSMKQKARTIEIPAIDFNIMSMIIFLN